MQILFALLNTRVRRQPAALHNDERALCHANATPLAEEPHFEQQGGSHQRAALMTSNACRWGEMFAELPCTCPGGAELRLILPELERTAGLIDAAARVTLDGAY